MSKWTPGPWETDGKAHNFSDTLIAFIKMSDGSIMHATGADADACAANARLIAAAPEMAHELRAQRNVLDAIAQTCANAASTRQTLDHIRGICEAQVDKPRALLRRIEVGR